jgi:hypothetical protein
MMDTSKLTWWKRILHALFFGNEKYIEDMLKVPEVSLFVVGEDIQE